MTSKAEEPGLPSEIREHYEMVAEAERLEGVESEIEKVRTQELLHRYLPPPPAVILDVGGGAGVYAFWLARRGYQVHLIDGTPRHIDQAEAATQKTGGPPLASIKLGDAQQLDHADSSVDGVLLLGPLYHLTERNDRILALREARRVLRPGGVVFAAAINRFASMIDALQGNLVDDPEFAPIFEQDLRNGQHRNPTGNPEYFTTAFFHHPQELNDEIANAGFRFEAMLAIEGPVRIMVNFAQSWAKPEMREKLLRLTRLTEAEPTLWGVSAHIMGIGKKG